MEPIRCLLVEDEFMTRQTLRRMLGRYDAISVVGEAGNVEDAVEGIRSVRPELVFLDIDLAGGDGFGLLQRLMPNAPWVVFVTGYERYAVRAFEVNALDYIVKPVGIDRLDQVVAHLTKRLRHEPPGRSLHAAPPSEAQDQLLIPAGRSNYFIRVNELLYIMSSGNYTTLLSSDAKEHIVRQTLADWELRLPAATFLRLDRTCIVNRARVQSLELATRSGVIRFDNGRTCLRLGHTAATRLKQMLS